MYRNIPKQRSRLVQEKGHDVYRSIGKLSQSTQCPNCEAVYINGRWTWQKQETATSRKTCPACRRIADAFPAGQVKIGGEFFRAHRGEILGLINNIEQRECAQHPLERIMSFVDEDDITKIATTGIHIARRIGEALSHAYKGKLQFQYGDGENSIQVSWFR